MEAQLSTGDRIRVRWRYDSRDKQVRITDSVLSKQKKVIYALPISIEEKRDLCDKILTEETVKQEITQCIITKLLDGKDDQKLAEVEVTRWFRDPDNKPLARKMTFEMAIKGLALSKEDKKAVWDKFLETVRLPKRESSAKKQTVYVVEVSK